MIDDDAIDALVRGHYEAVEPLAEVPRKRRWTRYLPEMGLAAAVGLVALSGALWWSGAVAPRAVEVAPDTVEDGVVEAGAGVPVVGEGAVDPERAEKIRANAERLAKLEAVHGTRPDPEVGWISGDDAVLDGPDVVVVHVEPWCPHCEPGLETMLDAADGTDVVVVAVSSLSRGATLDEFEALLNAVEHDGPAGIIADVDVEDTFGTSASPAAIRLHNGVVVDAGHPRVIAEGL